jgi:hypothetical protein
MLVQPEIPEGLDPDEVLDAFVYGFTQWDDTGCLPFESPGADLASCPGEVQGDDVNCAFWVPTEAEWNDREFGQFGIALSLVHHVPETGEIVDVDLAMKGFISWEPFELCSDECAEACAFDLAGTVTHELGHFFGLDHSGIPDATMAEGTFPGDCKKRSLHEDDADGICTVYAGLPADPPAACAGGGGAGGGGGTVRKPRACAAGEGAAGWLLGFAALALSRLASSRRSRPRSRRGRPASPARS